MRAGQNLSMGRRYPLTMICPVWRLEVLERLCVRRAAGCPSDAG